MSKKSFLPPIFDICHCYKCNEIVWGGKLYIRGHNLKNIIYTAERNKRVSEGKKKWYNEHPEVIFEKSERMKGDKNLAKKLRIREKISNKLKGHIVTSETKEKIANGNRNKKRHSDDFKKRLSNRMLGNNYREGKYHSEETKIKMSIAHAGEKSYRWKNGTSFEPYCPKFNRRKKEEIRELYGKKCANCGKDQKNNITKTNKVRKLYVHHIDMDKMQGCNDKGWKLVPLCMSCHSKLHHNKIKLEE